MTAVDTTTGEVVQACTADEARDLTDSIRHGLEFVWEDVVEAYQRQAWKALEYNSWNHYCTQEFGASNLKLPKEDRRETVASLRDSGLSTRAIAAATGVDRKTIRRDLASPQVGEKGPPAEPVTGTDGKTYQPTQPAKTTVTERESFSRKTETEPSPDEADGGPEGARDLAPSGTAEPDDADAINAGFERHADPRLTFRANFSKDLARAGQLRMVDVDKAVASADPDDLAGFRQSVQSIRDWCDRFLTTSASTHLRRVK